MRPYCFIINGAPASVIAPHHLAAQKLVEGAFLEVIYVPDSTGQKEHGAIVSSARRSMKMCFPRGIAKTRAAHGMVIIHTQSSKASATLASAIEKVVADHHAASNTDSSEQS